MKKLNKGLGNLPKATQVIDLNPENLISESMLLAIMPYTMNGKTI